jgi:ketosteroid isomerase-like protein
VDERIEKLLVDNDIRDLLARYTDAVYRKDWEAVSDCWASDGVWHAFGQKTEGRAEIIGWLTALTAMFSLIWQNAHTMILEIDGDVATARLYVDEITCDMGDVRRFAMGIYHDRYKRIENKWVFAERHWDLLYLGDSDLSAKIWEMPTFGPPPYADMDRPNRPTLAEIQSELGL